MALCLALSGLFLFAAQNKEKATQDAPPAAFVEMMKAEPGLILDVRTSKEVAKGMIEGAQHLDFYGEAFETELGKLPKEQPVYVYCRSGGRSGKTMAMMEKLGFKNVVNLAGGMLAWEKAGLPIAK